MQDTSKLDSTSALSKISKVTIDAMEYNFTGQKLPLHIRLKEYDMENIRNKFLEANRQNMNEEQFKKMLQETANITYTPEELHVLFMKMNTSRDGWTNWDEFVSHLMLGFQEQEVTDEAGSIEDPICTAPKILRSRHRHPVVRFTFFPAVLNDRTTNFIHGSYVTVSKDGVINYWDLGMNLKRTVLSTCPELKIRPTWITDLVCLPDVSVVCTSSTERDLRFYDTSAKKFELRVMITSFHYAVVNMFYHFKKDINEDCKLILGDMGGNVLIIIFSPIGRGPFKSKPGTPLTHLRYDDVVKGRLPTMRIVEFKNMHTDWVRQVAYYPSLQFFVSVSNCPKQAMVLSDIGAKTQYSFKVAKGIWCFAIGTQSHLIATGGPDCIIRIWNPFVPQRPNIVFPGHHAAIVGLVIQDDIKLISLGTDKCVKVWDLKVQCCLQTYVNLPPELGEYVSFAIFYNPRSREIFIGGMKIAIVVCSALLDAEQTDGYTHTAPVSVILYNPLFKSLVSCGLDSCFFVWDIWTGRRMMAVKEAHTRSLRGETLSIEITAAAFDPGYQLLITGAGDGTLKVWNFNTGTCVRNMNIEPECEVTAIIWIKNRILAAGWSQHVTEFADTPGSVGGSDFKNWETRHNEDILCCVARVPQTFTSSSYNGELVMWRLETAQPYKRFHVGNPGGKLTLHYGKKSVAAQKPSASRSTSTSKSRSGKSMDKFSKRCSVLNTRTQTDVNLPQAPTLTSLNARAKRISVVRMPATVTHLRQLAVHSMIFLSTRPMLADIGTLMVAVENGTIQVWSHHPAGGFIVAFSAIHSAGDYVISMETDSKNDYLFTGHTSGYVKIWLMKNFALQTEVKVCMPEIRVKFPFMWKSFIECRAKRAVRGQHLPVLLSSSKNHKEPVSGLQYIDDAEILASCSADHTVRLWTLGGRYLSTLGTFRPWTKLTPDGPQTFAEPPRIPPDLKRCVSSTTVKVMQCGNIERRPRKKKEKRESNLSDTLMNKGVYGKRISEPLLGKHFQLPSRSHAKYDVKLDSTYRYIPVYSHLILPEPDQVTKCSTPVHVNELRQTLIKQNFT